MSDSGEVKTPEEVESQRAEEEPQSQQMEVAESSNKSRLDEDSEKVARTEDDDALLLACPICKTPFLDPVVTNCDHYFCNLCALKHHEKDTTCFVCKNPTLGVFKPSVEIKNKIAKMREHMKPQLESQAAEEEYQSQQREVAESSKKRKLDEDTEKVARTEDSDALPLACPICKTPFLDPVVTNCDHFFCNLCARKHHENDTTCFVCKNPTLGVFKPTVEIKYKMAKVLENAKPHIEAQPAEDSEVAESSNKIKLDEDSEQDSRAEDDDALPLACPFCEIPFLDPVVTTCDHYFCNLCARKHHKNDATCFVCKNPTLGVFKPSVEIKNKIAKMREHMKPQENKADMFDFEEYTSQYIRNYYQGGPLLLRVLHMVTHKLLDEEEDNLQALQFLFDRLKPGKHIYRTNPEFLQLVSDLIGGRKGEKYIASQDMLQDMQKQYTEILAIASSSPPSREVEDMERYAHVLGSFLYASGHVREAYEALSKVQSTILFMVVALEAQQFDVLCSLRAVETLRGVSCYEEMTMKEDCVRALAHLCRGDYYIAACKFQELMNMRSIRKLWTHWAFELLNLDDIHMLCTWTAMATMTRSEIEKVADDMDTITFKVEEEIENQKKKRVNYSYRYLLSQYNARNYSECIRFLHQQLQAKARKDIYLFDHVDRLFHLIKERCMRESEKFCSDFDKLSVIINN